MKAQGKDRGVKEDRNWTCICDGWLWGGDDPPEVTYCFSVNRKGEHPQEHLKGFAGILQADACAGLKALYQPGSDGKVRVREAACRARLRREFHDVWKATGPEMAKTPLDRIGALGYRPSDPESVIPMDQRPVMH